MKTIAVYSLKGGVGKTMTAATLAHMYATRKYRRRLRPHTKQKYGKVLLVDADTQGNLSQYYRRLGADGESTLSDALNVVGNTRATVRRNIIGTDWLFMDALTGGMNLYDTERDMYEKKDTGRIKAVLEAVQSVYDLCIIDCPPAMNMLTVNALTAATDLIVPVRVDAFSTRGLAELEQQLQGVRQINPGLHMIGVLVTHYQRTRIMDDAVHIISERFPVLRTKIWYSRYLAESTLIKTPIGTMGMRLGPAKQYRAALCDIIEKMSKSDKEGNHGK